MDARLREGIDRFNAGRFFEAHETLENFYQEAADTEKPFLEGLIQLCVAFRMFSEFGETQGPIRLIRQALIRFENFQPVFLQIRVKKLSERMEAWTNGAKAAGSSAPSPIPQIPLQRFNFFS